MSSGPLDPRQSRPHRPSELRSRGFSLVEVLITIVIMALVTGLVFQGLGSAARLTLRLSDEADRLDRSAMTSDWWRVSVMSALPAPPDPEAPDAPRPPNLIGTSDTLSMETAASLSARFGAPRQVAWSIQESRGASDLVYQSGSERWTVARSRKSGARFAYWTQEGGWQESWNQPDPPRLVVLENFFDAPVLAHPRSRAVQFQPSEKPALGL